MLELPTVPLGHSDENRGKRNRPLRRRLPRSRRSRRKSRENEERSQFKLPNLFPILMLCMFSYFYSYHYKMEAGHSQTFNKGLNNNKLDTNKQRISHKRKSTSENEEKNSNKKLSMTTAFISKKTTSDDAYGKAYDKKMNVETTLAHIVSLKRDEEMSDNADIKHPVDDENQSTKGNNKVRVKDGTEKVDDENESKENSNDKERVKDGSEKLVLIDPPDIGKASPNSNDKSRTKKNEKVNVVKDDMSETGKGGLRLERTGHKVKFIRKDDSDSISNDVNEKVKEVENTVKDVKFIREGDSDSSMPNEINDKVIELENSVKELEKKLLNVAGTASTEDTPLDVAKVEDASQPKISEKVVSVKSKKVTGADASSYMEKYEKYLKKVAERV